MRSGFHQIRIKIFDIEKTAFNSKHGHLEFKVVPMGLGNARAIFQTQMNSIFYDRLDEFVVLYIDDLLFFSKNRLDCLKHLDIVISLIQEHNLFVGRNKCHFMTDEIDFLCLKVMCNGIDIHPLRVQASQNGHDLRQSAKYDHL